MDKNIVAFLDAKAVTVKVMFEGTGQEYTYVCNLPDVQVGDTVVVPVHVDNNFALVTVIECHASVELEPNSKIGYKWVAARVNLEPYGSLLVRNKEITKSLTQAYKAKMRAAYIAEVAGALPDGVMELLK